MSFLQDAGKALMCGWIIGIAFSILKLPAPVPPVLGLIGAVGIIFGGYCYRLLGSLLLKQ
ncbi:XapX domain-containing protein [Microcoleus sp. bin38.metabat.b11b12b14.051]|uniref:XapX domain-containing protein n=1 Tax=Microcoleus sp. bin38.metabat.b11b12b14.051 TaxID=2742709 RepID=UPI0025D95243|nr:XapX domain-containing protein [Microcoleus sp. bin38.metabat.b11b12b14.051]